ncbi:perlucin-like protein [Argopecten irradians]|uniref:perlucin-like protein n=1 Tax=Argopecten irradians TaxID=31199 RepID=UPI003719CED9
MMAIFRLHLVIITLSMQVARGCLPGWTAFGGSCYSLSFDKLDWIAASAACCSVDAYLLEIEGENENKFISAIITNQYKHGSYWLGGSDVFVEGDWRWMNTNQRFNYTNWQQEQPSNLPGYDCVGAHSDDYSFRWRDYDCTEKHKYICEARSGTWIIFG